MHQSTTPSLSKTIWPRWASRQFLNFPIVQTLLPVIFGYSLSSEAVVMRQLRRWKRLWQRSLTGSHKRTCMGHSRSCCNGTSALLVEKITSKGTINKSAHTKKPGNLFNDPRIYARSTKSSDCIVRSSSFLLHLVIFKNAFTFGSWCYYALIPVWLPNIKKQLFNTKDSI